MATEIDLAEYLFRRLSQLGVGAIHGVPGSYNLTALDYVETCGLAWVGNASELTAGYAADGYARIKGISAITTTFGVGELSSINAIAGAYAEFSPVVHIVGTPPLAGQSAGAYLHHTLGDGNFRAFAEMAAKVTVAQTNLVDPGTAVAEIDRVLLECITQSRPVYIELPTSSVTANVPTSALNNPLSIHEDQYDESLEDVQVDTILQKIYTATQPLIIIDGLTRRFNIDSEADELVRTTGFPTVTTLMGKGILSERYPNYHGIFFGAADKNIPAGWVNKCDLVLKFGPLESDINTSGFSALTDRKVTVLFHKHYIHTGSLPSPPADTPALSQPTSSHHHHHHHPPPSHHSHTPLDPAAPLTQDLFWRHFISPFLLPHDILLADPSTALLGVTDLLLPEGARIINSGIWASIGFALGAAQGAALARRELVSAGGEGGRTILFAGDGSFQMNPQAASDVIRNELDLLVFVVNNDGYTVERYLHGGNKGYNDVQPWAYGEAGRFFGGRSVDGDGAVGGKVNEEVQGYGVLTKRAATWGELEDVLEDERVRKGKGLVLVELIFGRWDCPEMMRELTRVTGERNAAGGGKGSESN